MIISSFYILYVMNLFIVCYESFKCVCIQICASFFFWPVFYTFLRNNFPTLTLFKHSLIIFSDTSFNFCIEICNSFEIYLGIREVSFYFYSKWLINCYRNIFLNDPFFLHCDKMPLLSHKILATFAVLFYWFTCQGLCQFHHDYCNIKLHFLLFWFFGCTV